MEFLPWKTINLDGSFRVTAPESVSEEILEEVIDGVKFRSVSYTHLTLPTICSV